MRQLGRAEGEKHFAQRLQCKPMRHNTESGSARAVMPSETPSRRPGKRAYSINRRCAADL